VRVPITIGSSGNPFCFQLFFYPGKKIEAKSPTLQTKCFHVILWHFVS
jgi:hypothetical protein